MALATMGDWDERLHPYLFAGVGGVFGQGVEFEVLLRREERLFIIFMCHDVLHREEVEFHIIHISLVELTLGIYVQTTHAVRVRVRVRVRS